MPMTALTGNRVRERRLLRGLRQADVAREAGISASYLNLIEHNRRRVSGEILERLAAALGVEAAHLAEGAEGALLADLRQAAATAAPGAAPPEVGRIEELVSRFPGWADLAAHQHRRLGYLEQTVAVLSDRMAQDPHLSAALHEVLSALSSVRSTAAILAEHQEIEPEWRARFHANLHADSERMAAGAEALVAYLDAADKAGQTGVATPQEELDAWLAGRAGQWQALEAGAPEAAVATLEAEAAGLASEAARVLARSWLAQARADAVVLPMAEFAAATAQVGPDPLVLAAHFRVDVIAAFRRLALVPGAEWGVVICDGSGTLTFRHPVEGFGLPRFGAACPLWPIYTALTRPMAPVRAVVEMAGRRPRRFQTLAVCRLRHPGGAEGPQVAEAAMLVRPLAGPGDPALPVGTTCRICPRTPCPGRREPSLIVDATTR